MEAASVMERAAAIPPPVVFDLDVAEIARFRDAYVAANGGRLAMALATFVVALQSVLPVLRLYRYHGNDPIDWALLAAIVVMLFVALSAIVYPRAWQRLLVRRQSGTVVTFDELGLTIVRGTVRPSRTKRIALAEVRSVRQTTEALFIFGRLQPIVTIPLRALPDGGAQIVSYFEERIIATRMLRRSTLRTTIVNTVSP